MALLIGGTSLLLHGNGADGSTVFTDETGKTVTAYGNAKISTAQSKFGGSSMAFGSSGDRLDVANSDALILGSGDFTIELFHYPLGTNGRLCTKRAYNATGTGSWRLNANGFEQLENPTSLLSWTSLPVGQWSHLAITRYVGVLHARVNGILAASVASSFNFSSTEKLTVGGDNDVSGASANGYIADLHIVKGVALYTADFTPPTAPLAVFPGYPVDIQPITPYGPPLAKYNPAIGKPVMQAITTDLTDRLPYGIPNMPFSNNINPWEFKGRGRVTGTVFEKALPANTPLRRLVRLHREPDGAFVKATWSDAATGEYIFDGIPAQYRYFVTSFDYSGAYRAVIADNITPTQP